MVQDKSMIQDTITHKLQQLLTPDHLEVVNESYMHSVPTDSETHFKVVIVSSAFESKRAVARHQMIYGELKSELDGEVHALALHTYTPNEWQLREQSSQPSPQCLGGSKSDER